MLTKHTTKERNKELCVANSYLIKRRLQLQYQVYGRNVHTVVSSPMIAKHASVQVTVTDRGDALEDGFFGNAFFTQVHQGLQLKHGILVLTKKTNIVNTLVYCKYQWHLAVLAVNTFSTIYRVYETKSNVTSNSRTINYSVVIDIFVWFN